MRHRTIHSLHSAIAASHNLKLLRSGRCVFSSNRRTSELRRSSLQMEEERSETKREFPIFNDVRRYACEYCGIVRSRKKLINHHIESHHQDEVKEKKGEEKRGNVCEECGTCFTKPAHLKQHMKSHSVEVCESIGSHEELQNARH